MGRREGKRKNTFQKQSFKSIIGSHGPNTMSTALRASHVRTSGMQDVVGMCTDTCAHRHTPADTETAHSARPGATLVCTDTHMRTKARARCVHTGQNRPRGAYSCPGRDTFKHSGTYAHTEGACTHTGMLVHVHGRTRYARLSALPWGRRAGVPLALCPAHHLFSASRWLSQLLCPASHDVNDTDLLPEGKCPDICPFILKSLQPSSSVHGPS